MKSAAPLIFVLSAFLFISCASTSKKAQKDDQEKKEAKNMTNQERIYHAKFSGAFYDRF